MNADLTWLDATAQADLVRRGEVTPVELVDAAVERIERVNPRLNAVVLPLYERARQVASGPLPDGPFRGVPFLLKDLGAALAGVPLTSGAAVLASTVPACDSYLVERYRAAGLVFVGKTNTPELGCLPTTEPRLFGPTRNPWNADHSTGGSSGGSAAAVAAGLVPAAHGNDGGGSIRIPASCCGLFGLKPSRGRVSLGPDAGDRISGMTCDHALTRTVRDSAALLDAIAGPMPGDPYWAPPPARPYAQEVGADPGRLRIAFATRAPRGSAVHPDCARAVEDAARLCLDLGHRVDEGAPDFDVAQYDRAFTVMFAAGLAAAIDGIGLQSGVPPAARMFEPATWAMYRVGKAATASDYLLAVAAVQQLTRQMAAFLSRRCDLWLTPTLAAPPPPLGTFAFRPEQFPLEAGERLLAYLAFTPICNSTGLPAASVPLYWSDAGLPVGVQFVAPYGGEDVLFRLAAQLEAARPWAQRRPPVSA